MPATATAEERAGWLARACRARGRSKSRALGAMGEVAEALARTVDAALVDRDTSSRRCTLGASGFDMLAAVAEARARSRAGQRAGDLGRHGAALDELETARQLWAQRVKRVEQSAADLHRKVLLLLYRVGDLKMAEQHLNEAERITLPPRGDAWTALRVGRSASR